MESFAFEGHTYEVWERDYLLIYRHGIYYLDPAENGKLYAAVKIWYANKCGMPLTEFLEKVLG
jgi:hypothetical protein